jgi:hypothetical protein
MKSLQGSIDMYDTDVAMRRHHSHRAAAELSQPTHFNYHLWDPKDLIGGRQERGRPFVELWGVYQLNSRFTHQKLFYQGQRLDMEAALTGRDYQFKELSANFNLFAATLLRLVPWEQAE